MLRDCLPCAVPALQASHSLCFACIAVLYDDMSQNVKAQCGSGPWPPEPPLTSVNKSSLLEVLCYYSIFLMTVRIGNEYVCGAFTVKLFYSTLHMMKAFFLRTSK